MLIDIAKKIDPSLQISDRDTEAQIKAKQSSLRGFCRKIAKFFRDKLGFYLERSSDANIRSKEVYLLAYYVR